MKKVCFITSHLMSGSETLFDILDQNPRVQGFRLNRPYVDVHSIMELAGQKHKLNNQAAICMDELNYNHFLQTKDAYKICKFIYVVRPPTLPLNQMVAAGIYKPQAAVNYYCYRLRRMCEMAKRTPGAVLLTWDDIASGRGFPLVEEYLTLKQKLEVVPMKKGTSATLVPYDLLQHADRAFNRYFHFLQHQPIVFCK